MLTIDDTSILFQVMAWCCQGLREQAITWANIDLYLWRRKVSLSHNDLNHKQLEIHRFVISTATPGHPMISIHCDDYTFVVLNQFHVEILPLVVVYYIYNKWY